MNLLPEWVSLVKLYSGMLECGTLTVFNRHIICFNEQDGSLLALIISTMPASIQKHFLDNFITVFPGKLKTTDIQANVLDRKSTRLNSSHLPTSRMPSSA